MVTPVSVGEIFATLRLLRDLKRVLMFHGRNLNPAHRYADDVAADAAALRMLRKHGKSLRGLAKR